MADETPNYKKPAWIASAVATVAGLVLTSGAFPDGGTVAQVVGVVVTIAGVLGGQKAVK